MIKASIYRNKKGSVYGFKVVDHGEPIVCAAVTALCMTLVGSIEAFTPLDFSLDAAEQGGDMCFTLPYLEKGGADAEAELLLNAFVLGLKQIEYENSNNLKVFD